MVTGLRHSSSSKHGGQECLRVAAGGKPLAADEAGIGPDRPRPPSGGRARASGSYDEEPGPNGFLPSTGDGWDIFELPPTVARRHRVSWRAGEFGGVTGPFYDPMDRPTTKMDSAPRRDPAKRRRSANWRRLATAFRRSGPV